MSAKRILVICCIINSIGFLGSSTFRFHVNLTKTYRNIIVFKVANYSEYIMFCNFQNYFSLSFAVCSFCLKYTQFGNYLYL